MKIALIGYGKMGKAIEDEMQAKDHAVLKITSQNLQELTEKNLQNIDVAIEFTNAQSAEKNIRMCIGAGIPVVSGSTGWLEKLEDIKKYCVEKNGSFLYASNFSIGVNIFFEVNKRLAELMASQKEYDVMMEEIHHKQKKDAPSGTAITIAEQVLAKISQKKKWVNSKTENKDELEIISERIDPVPGTHKVKYASSIDDIEIIHTAHNRRGFAQGALVAAAYIKNRKGIFEMKNVLEIS